MTRASLGFPRGSHAPREAVTLTASETLLPTDSGKIFFLNAAAGLTVTLPAVADAGPGWHVEIIVATNCTSNSYAISSPTNDMAISVNELETDTNDDGPSSEANTTMTIGNALDKKGDHIRIFGDGTSYYAIGQTALDGGVAIT